MTTDDPARQGRSPGSEHLDEDVCRSFQRTVEVVGRKWTAAVLMAGLRGARRFVEYRARVPGISDRLLARRLRDLEEDGLLERRVTPSTPVLVTYLPTERARGLMGVLHPLILWSVADQEPADDGPRDRPPLSARRAPSR